jgi:hypothetical protein
MPATYTIDQDAGVVRVECSGVFTNQDMLECIEHVFSDPARKPGMPTLVNCQHVQYMQVTPQGMEAAATIKSTLIDVGQPPWALAFIAPQKDMFWLARTYEVLRVGSPETVRVFRHASDAETWLAGLRAMAPLWLVAFCC